jgi:hypothetical protein
MGLSESDEARSSSNLVLLHPRAVRVRRKRALLLASCLIGLSVLAVGQSREGGVSKAMILAALRDPLSMFSDRSPGDRGLGPLLSIKSDAWPHERVLASLRDQGPASDLPPETDGPIVSNAPQSLESRPGSLPMNPISGMPAFGPSFFDTPFLYSSPPPGIPAQLTTPEGTLPGAKPPGGTSPGGLPGQLVIQVQAPATWTIMLIGLLGVGAIMRLRRLLPPQSRNRCCTFSS